MINFKRIDIEDINWINEKFSQSDSLAGDVCFSVIYTYYGNDKYNLFVAEVEGFACFKANCGKNTKYLMPIGVGNRRKAIEQLMKDARSIGHQFILYGVSEQDKVWMETEFPHRFISSYIRDLCEYIFTAQKLAELPGCKLRNKRHEIEKFKMNKNWCSIPLTKECIPECISLTQEWYELYADKQDEYALEDIQFFYWIINQYDKLGLIGRIVKVDDRAVAYTIGVPYPNKRVVYDLFEKGIKEITGAYAMARHEFVTKDCIGYQYINLGSDMGEEGLRISKSRYDPDILFAKYEMRLEERLTDKTIRHLYCLFRE